MMPEDSITASHAVDFKIPPQGAKEDDTSFRTRVAGAIRDQGHLIEAHEAQQNSRYDAGGDSGAAVMDGLMGAASLALSGCNWHSRRHAKVGDEIVAGLMARHGPTKAEKEASDAALIALFNFTGGRPF